MYHLTRCLVLGHNNCISLVWTYDSSISWYVFGVVPNGALRHVEGTPEALSFSEWESTPSGDPADYYFASVSGGQPSGEGDKLGFNIDNAVNYLNAHANEQSVHACGRYVGLALQAGGIKGAMADGKDYGPILLKNGFRVVETNGYSPIKGDVTVVDGNAAHKWGHVQMYNGDQWVSDFFQGCCSTKPGYEYGGNGFMVYTKNIPSLTIYRIGN